MSTIEPNEPLPKVPLGTTGMEITRVGFGAWAIGGSTGFMTWSHQDDDESVAAIHAAVERGINWIDTAAIYGTGHSEEVVGRALRELSAADRPYVFTKCGLRPNAAGPSQPNQRVGDPAFIREEVENSLRRLGVEQIDLYQMHWPADDGTPLEVYWSTLLELQQAGKVRAVGLSNHTTAHLEAAEQVGHVGTLQPPFSAIRRDVAASELPWCDAHQTGVIVYSPMQSGLLTGTFSEARMAALPADDWRTRSPFFTGEALQRNVALAEALRPIAERHGVSVGAVAVAWTLAWPGVTGAIVGARSPQQVDGWLPAATLQLTGADLDEIAAGICRTGAGNGPDRPASNGGSRAV
jgi:aryl-alcohol dehydrogenase-like predicted oxidoreductase